MKKFFPTKQLTIFTLMVFCAFLATIGILSLFPTDETAAAEDSELTKETEEVFSVLPQTLNSEVFADFIAPVKGRIFSPYGYRNDPFSDGNDYHRGVDVAVSEGTDVFACADGTVKASAYSKIGGNYVILVHDNGAESYYGHLQKRTVAKGDAVKQGDVIGISGATGKVTGAHLHFQLTYNGRTVDPTRYVDLVS